MSGHEMRRPARLRAGDVVTVRAKEEILAMLDADGKLEKLPFMPEMLEFCGRQFRIAAVAHKTCDPAHKTGGRRLENAVHLEGLRCSGAAHGGCQASCLLFWKTDWLKRVDDDSQDSAKFQAGITEAELQSSTLAPSSTADKPVYSCQATCLFDATRPLKWWDVRQYVRDLTSRNVPFGRWSRLLVLSWVRALTRVGFAYRLSHAVYGFVHRLLIGRSPPEPGGGLLPSRAPTPVRALDLQPGEWVRVRTHHEIRETLTVDNKNRGMWFDDEQTVFCGSSHQVEQRVERIINEVTGEMMPMKTPCITLRGVQCRSMYSRDRLFCPRAITPYWREIWLERVAAPLASDRGKTS